MKIKYNLIWNFSGIILPMLAAVFSIPIFIDKLGVERFGILSLAWVLVGYFGFFDFGLGRAMTQLIARKTGNGQKSDVPAVVYNGMILMTLLGGVGGVIVAFLSPWLVNNKLAIPLAMQSETLTALLILAASVPIVIVSTGLRGILEAYHRFDLVNIVKTPLAALTYLAPLLVLPYSSTLPPVVMVLLLGRFLMSIAYFAIILYTYPKVFQKTEFDYTLLKKLLSFGGWMTLSNVAAPLLLYLGRFLLAVMISAEAVAYFSTPYDIVVNLLLIPGVFVSTLFPIFSEKIFQDQNYVNALYNQWMRYTFLLMFQIGRAHV